MRKLFTLVELIIVIAVLGILAAIIIPNISDFQKEGNNTAIKSNVRNLQTSVDMYALDYYGNFPTYEKPTEFQPKPINFDLITPKYNRQLPKTEGVKYWVDYWGKVWASTIDAPENVRIDSGTLKWDDVQGADTYYIYEVENYEGTSNINKAKSKLKKIGEDNQNNKVFTDIEVNHYYVVTAIDKNGFESAPAGATYKGYSTYKGSIDFLYEEYFKNENYKGLETTANWLSGSLTSTSSNLLMTDIDSGRGVFKSIIEDGKGGYIAVGYDGTNSTNRYGWIYFLDSNFNLIERKSSGSSSTGYVFNNIFKDDDGNYIILGERVDNYDYDGGDAAFIVKYDSSFNHMGSQVLSYRDEYHDRLHYITQNSKGNYIVTGEDGGQWCQGLWFIEFDKDLNIIQQNSDVSLCSGPVTTPIVTDGSDNYYILRQINYEGVIEKYDSNFNFVSRVKDTSTRSLYGLIKNNQGNIVVSGYSSEGHPYVAEYDFSLNKLDSNLLTSIRSTYYHDIIQNNVGGYVAVGYTSESDLVNFGGNIGKGSQDFVISLYDQNFNFLNLYNTGSSKGDFMKKVIQDSNNDYVVIGTTQGDLSNIGGDPRTTPSYYHDHAFMKFKSEEGFNVTNNVLHSNEINLKEERQRIKIHIDSTLSSNTNYTFYVSTDNTNWQEVYDTYINTSQDLGLLNPTSNLYWKLELQGTSNETPVIHSIKIE